MANIIKHIGKHNDQKVIVVFRKVPNEEHMALVIYPDRLNSVMHDSLMAVLQSEEGQVANEFADVLDRKFFPNGTKMLITLHQEGLIKKVAANQVLLTPNAGTSQRLDEVNRIMDDMAKGKEAVARMAELDANAGLIDPVEKARNEALLKEAGETAMDDKTIALDLINQAAKMETESKSLLAESKRLKKEAYKLNPGLKPTRSKA